VSARVEPQSADHLLAQSLCRGVRQRRIVDAAVDVHGYLPPDSSWRPTSITRSICSIERYLCGHQLRLITARVGPRGGKRLVLARVSELDGWLRSWAGNPADGLDAWELLIGRRLEVWEDLLVYDLRDPFAVAAEERYQRVRWPDNADEVRVGPPDYSAYGEEPF
jgi:hypothetical protein